jgi:arylsulfatase A-like enzyme
MKKGYIVKQKIKCVGIALACFYFIPGLAQTGKRKPNILVIITDQWRGQALGYLGKEKVKTPCLDSLAKESLTLTQTVANYPVCSPSRAMLMTGTYPVKNKVSSNCNSASAPFGVELPKDITCWSDILKAKGYSNGYIGKWHLDAPHKPYIPTSNNTEIMAWNEWTPSDRRHGFDYWYAYNTYDKHDRPMYWDTKSSRDSFHYVNQWGPEHEADKAIDFFNNKGNIRKEGSPFALVVSINPPHEPYNTAPEKYHQPYKNIPVDSLLGDADIPAVGTPMGDEYRRDVKNYYANITGVDQQIGRIISALRTNKLLDNTIILITADHGNCLGKHDEHSKNNIYEESLRIPFIIYWKGKIKPGIDDQFLFSMQDVYPTLLDLAGFKKTIPTTVDGESRADYFLNRKGKSPTEQFIMGAIASSNAELNSGFRGIRTARYKLAYQKTGKQQQGYLFDLKNDPFEMNNIYSKDNEQVKLFRDKLEQWLKKTNDGFIVED